MQPDHAVIVPPGAGLRVGNVEFLGLSEHSPRVNVSVTMMAPGRDGPRSTRTPTRTTSSTCSTASDLRRRPRRGPGAGRTFVLVPPGVEHTSATARPSPCGCSTSTRPRASTGD